MSGVIFYAYSIGPTFSSLESMVAPSKGGGEHGEKCDNSGQKKHQGDESREKSFSNQRKRIYLVNNIFEAWEMQISRSDKDIQ